jgi:hypothetical protein
MAIDANDRGDFFPVRPSAQRAVRVLGVCSTRVHAARLAIGVCQWHTPRCHGP